jgi:hypothetical protein
MNATVVGRAAHAHHDVIGENSNLTLFSRE